MIMEVWYLCTEGQHHL